jgi:CBS domain-containing protein
MKLEHLAIATGSMRRGMTMRDFFEEAVRCNVPGLPYVDAQERITGRISIRDVYKRIAVPDNLLLFADALGDRTDNLDLPEMKVMEMMRMPAENFLLENMPTVSPRSSVVKALALMELHNSSYVFLIEDGAYVGVVTRMVIAMRMMACVSETDPRPAPE